MKDEKSTLESNTIATLELAYSTRISDLKRSVELATEALAMSRGINNMTLVVKGLNHLALFYMIMGEYDNSTKLSEESIRICEELNDEVGLADAKYNLAGICYKTDNHHLGVVYLLDCLVIYKKFNDYHNQSKAHKSLGTIYEYFRDVANAERHYQYAVETARNAGDRNLESNAYNSLSGVYLKRRRTVMAMETIEKSVVMKQETGDIRGLAFAIYGRGKVYTSKRNFAKAKADFEESIKLHEKMSERLGLAMAYNKLGEMYIKMKDLTSAKKILKKGVSFSSRYNIILGKLKCNYNLYLICKMEGNLNSALEYLELYQSLREQIMNAQTLRAMDGYEIIIKMKEMEKEALFQRENALIIEKKNRAEEALRIKQEFMSTMSHEIRTPLNAVISIASMLKERAEEADQKLLESMNFSANNLLAIVNDILDYSKLESGKMKLDERPVLIRGLLSNIFNMYLPLAQEKGITLELIADDRLSLCYELDEIRLTQILGNLISNAIKFTSVGKVELSAEIFNSIGEKDVVVFRVTDTGDGIESKYLDEIFESFAQPRLVTTRKQGGTGLGLSIVKKLVELHGSSIHVESQYGQGSVFSFELQLQRATHEKEDSNQPVFSLENILVLVVDDNPMNTFIVEKLLEMWGVKSETAACGMEALEKSKQKKFDLIFMDIHMPEMNGYETSRAIRKKGNPNFGTPIYALTADVTADQDEKYLDCFTGFLKKPIEQEKMKQVLNSVG
jgi:signal transduction histidine kinase/CheY-like chemotaxis protein